MHRYTYTSPLKDPDCSKVAEPCRAVDAGSPKLTMLPCRPKHAYGFTLIELMVVVIIISVVAALTIPSIVGRMRERRAGEAASRVALLYQMARSEAIGRGAAVLVRYTQPTPQGAFLVREAQRGTAAGAGCQSLPDPSCTSTNWDNPVTAQYRDLTSLDLGQRSEYARVRAEMVAPDGSKPNFVDVCFTPMGRSYVRTSAGATLSQLTGIYQASVYRGDSGEAIGLTRNVMLLPNGVARVVATAGP